jgi:hypothetical protein
VSISCAPYPLAAPLQNWANRLPRLTAELKLRFDAVQQFIQQMRDMAGQTEKITRNGGNPSRNTQVSRDGGADLFVVGSQTDRNRANRLS